MQKLLLLITYAPFWLADQLLDLFNTLDERIDAKIESRIDSYLDGQTALLIEEVLEMGDVE